MNALVLDTSILAAWALGEGSATAEAAIERLRDAEGHAPILLAWEFSNVLVTLQRRNRINPTQAARAAELLRHLELSLHEFSADYLLGSVAALASIHGLTTYDATYLDLAMRLGGTLATLDEALVRGAEAVGVPVFSAAK
jgi:predicted nucleic acid-binding protein